MASIKQMSIEIEAILEKYGAVNVLHGIKGNLSEYMEGLREDEEFVSADSLSDAIYRIEEAINFIEEAEE